MSSTMKGTTSKSRRRTIVKKRSTRKLFVMIKDGEAPCYGTAQNGFCGKFEDFLMTETRADEQHPIFFPKACVLPSLFRSPSKVDHVELAFKTC